MKIKDYILGFTAMVLSIISVSLVYSYTISAWKTFKNLVISYFNLPSYFVYVFDFALLVVSLYIGALSLSKYLKKG